MTYLSGFIAILGPPNVGKSTLLNRMLGTRVAIVSPKPQTTRNRIIGIYHGEGYQMAFMDTPGIHTTRTPLHRSMVASALASCREVDLIAMMIDVHGYRHPEIPEIVRTIRKSRKPSILIINKIDLIPKERLLPIIAQYDALGAFESIVPVSALKEDGVEAVLQELRSRLVPGPPFFPPDMKTDQSESFMAAEIIREKIYMHTREELPYSSAVTIEKMEELPSKNLLFIAARIHVERPSQKGILVGQKGRMIKTIGRSARMDLEAAFQIRVFLDLHVGVEANWTQDTRALRRLGY